MQQQPNSNSYSSRNSINSSNSRNMASHAAAAADTQRCSPGAITSTKGGTSQHVNNFAAAAVGRDSAVLPSSSCCSTFASSPSPSPAAPSASSLPAVSSSSSASALPSSSSSRFPCVSRLPPSSCPSASPSSLRCFSSSSSASSYHFISSSVPCSSSPAPPAAARCMRASAASSSSAPAVSSSSASCKSSAAARVHRPQQTELLFPLHQLQQELDAATGPAIFRRSVAAGDREQQRAAAARATAAYLSFAARRLAAVAPRLSLSFVRRVTEVAAENDLRIMEKEDAAEAMCLACGCLRVPLVTSAVSLRSVRTPRASRRQRALLRAMRRRLLKRCVAPQGGSGCGSTFPRSGAATFPSSRGGYFAHRAAGAAPGPAPLLGPNVVKNVLAMRCLMCSHVTRVPGCTYTVEDQTGRRSAAGRLSGAAAFKLSKAAKAREKAAAQAAATAAAAQGPLVAAAAAAGKDTPLAASALPAPQQLEALPLQQRPLQDKQEQQQQQPHDKQQQQQQQQQQEQQQQRQLWQLQQKGQHVQQQQFQPSRQLREHVPQQRQQRIQQQLRQEQHTSSQHRRDGGPTPYGSKRPAMVAPALGGSRAGSADSSKQEAALSESAGQPPKRRRRNQGKSLLDIAVGLHQQLQQHNPAQRQQQSGLQQQARTQSVRQQLQQQAWRMGQQQQQPLQQRQQLGPQLQHVRDTQQVQARRHALPQWLQQQAERRLQGEALLHSSSGAAFQQKACLPAAASRQLREAAGNTVFAETRVDERGQAAVRLAVAPAGGVAAAAIAASGAEAADNTLPRTTAAVGPARGRPTTNADEIAASAPARHVAAATRATPATTVAAARGNTSPLNCDETLPNSRSSSSSSDREGQPSLYDLMQSIGGGL